MYLPPKHAETRPEVLHRLIRSQPLGAWIVSAQGELVANHVPFLLVASRGMHGCLVAHVARANPVWQLLDAQPSLVIFQGAQSYVSPSWYPGKQQHGMAVPTWNYVVVHAHGIARAIEDTAWLRAHVEALTDAQEASQALPWRVSDAPADFIDRMVSAIVGIEIPIERLVGKWKASQNRTAADRLGVAAGLASRGDAGGRDGAAGARGRGPEVTRSADGWILRAGARYGRHDADAAITRHTITTYVVAIPVSTSPQAMPASRIASPNMYRPNDIYVT